MKTIDLIANIKTKPFVENTSKEFKEVRSFVQLHQIKFDNTGAIINRTNEELAFLLSLNFEAKDIKKAAQSYSEKKLSKHDAYDFLTV
jgi:hypothetical protein